MTVRIIMTTYTPSNECVRAGYGIRVLDSLKKYLMWPVEEDLVVHIADDGSPEPHAEDLRGYAQALGFDTLKTSVPRLGIGGSLNRSLGYVPDSDLWMYITDDWVLNDRFDLTYAQRLCRYHDYDYVRLGPTHPNIMCKTRYEGDIGFWLELLPDITEGYAFATRPFLATKFLWQMIGPFLEKADAYATERDYAQRVRRFVHEGGRLKMGEVGDLVGPWVHIGEFEVGRIQP